MCTRKVQAHFANQSQNTWALDDLKCIQIFLSEDLFLLKYSCVCRALCSESGHSGINDDVSSVTVKQEIMSALLGLICFS